MPIAARTTLLFCFRAVAKETTDSRSRPYREQHARKYGQPQFPTVKLWAEPQYEDEYNKKRSERDVGFSFFNHAIPRCRGFHPRAASI
jgi:hypothetical protein